MNLIGKTVTAIRPLTLAELRAEGWPGWVQGYRPLLIEFSDGTKLYPSQDEEGNGPGVFFGVTSDGQAFMLDPIADLEAA